jgi:hypothetical protein
MCNTLASILIGLTLLLNAHTPAPAPNSQTPRPAGSVEKTIEIEGKLGWYGNSYFRLPNGAMGGTERYHPWEGYFVETGGKKYILDLPILDEQAERLKGTTVRVSGVLEHRQMGLSGQTFSMPFLCQVRLTLTEETLLEQSYPGTSSYWHSADEVYALKTRDRRSRLEHIRALLGEDLKGGMQAVRLDSDRLVVRTSAAKHARIKAFLHLLQVIPGPAC